MSIRKNIIRLREIYQVTQEQLADIAGVSRGAVAQWEGGFTEPRMGAIQKMADYFKIAKWNIIEDGGMDELEFTMPVNRPRGAMSPFSGGRAVVPLKVLGRVHAGELADEETIDKSIEIPQHVYESHKNAFLLEVDGDCMNRIIPSGYHVLVDPFIQPNNGDVAVVETPDYQAIMRRWYRGSSALMLVADSYEEFEDIIFSQEDVSVKVLGTVVWSQRSFE